MRKNRKRDIVAWLVLGGLGTGFVAHLASGAEPRILDRTLSYLAR